MVTRVRVLRSAVALAVVCLSACTNHVPAIRSVVANGSPTSSSPSPATPSRQELIGRSVRGRAISAWFLSQPDAARRVLVIGCVHGDEAAGLPLSRALLRTRPPAGTEVVVVPDANPDGRLSGTRQNAHGVDLNRNFPFQWRAAGRAGDQQFPGSGSLSEPEARAIAALIERLRPTVSVWFHQPVDVVDLSGGSAAVETRFAQVAGLRLRRLTRYPGSATGWQNHRWPDATAFVVELPRPLSAAVSSRVLRALRDLER